MVNPADVLKTRLLQLSKGAGEENYNGIVDAFKKIEGPSAFFNGSMILSMVSHKWSTFWFSRGHAGLREKEELLAARKEGQLKRDCLLAL